MDAVADFAIERARWGELTTDQFFEIVRLRYEVYALEQRVDAEDFDEIDRSPTTEHWWIRDANARLSAYLRLLIPSADEPHPALRKPADWAVGRMVVRQDRRRRGLAQRLLDASLTAHPNDAFFTRTGICQSAVRKVRFRCFW